MIRTEEGGGRSVNDMYTQTGRTTDQKEGKTARKTKRGKLPKELDLNVLVLLTILNHPVYSSRFLPFVLCCSSYYSSSSSSTFSSSFYNQRCRTCLSLSLSPRVRVSLLFVAHAPMRNNHCSKIVSPARACTASQGIRCTVFL